MDNAPVRFDKERKSRSYDFQVLLLMRRCVFNLSVLLETSDTTAQILFDIQNHLEMK